MDGAECAAARWQQPQSPLAGAPSLWRKLPVRMAGRSWAGDRAILRPFQCFALRSAPLSPRP